MRAVITISGVGNRRTGTSKAGRAYDFTPIAFTFPANFFTGEKAATVNVDQSILGDYIPVVGDQVDTVIHEDFTTGRVYIDALL